MALRWVEGFECLGGSAASFSSGASSYADVAAKYAVASFNTGTGAPVLGTGRLVPGLAMQYTTVSGSFSQKWEPPTFGAQATWIVGMALNDGNCTLDAVHLCALLTGGNGGTEQIAMRARTNVAGKIYWEIFVGSTVVATTAQFNNNSWYYLEFKVTVATSGGSAEIKVNQVSAATFSGNTANAGTNNADTVQFNMGNANTTAGKVWQIDDMYICDGSGSLCNGYLGDSVVEGRLPNANGGTNQWTPNTSTNFSRVNEAINDGDTSYVVTNAVGNIDLYQHAALSYITGTIWGVQVQTSMRLESSGTHGIGIMYQDPSSNQGLGSTHTVTNTGYQDYTDIFMTDPYDGSSWSVTKINGGQFGIELVS